jgi:alpha-D-ribose 1-methylphosphonate 5-triphosphate synthase subunit PhnG
MSTTGATAVRVELGDRQAQWSADAGFTGDPFIVGRARFAVMVGLEVPVGGQMAVAGDDTAEAALAALFSADPDRTRILSADPAPA